MLNRMLAATLTLMVASLTPAQAQTPTKVEAQAIVANLDPVFLGGRKTSVSATFDTQNDLVILTDYGVKPKPGQRVIQDLCSDSVLFDVKVLDSATLVRTRLGSLRVTIADNSPIVVNFTITDVIHRGGADVDWKIAHEHVTVWPRDQATSNEVCKVVRKGL